jgi:hypothetical protein
MKKINWIYALSTISLVLIALSPELALAQSSNTAQSSLNSLITDPYFKKSLDFGLIIFAGYQWFLYFNNFNPANAFKEAIVPAVITWFAFQWPTAFKWVGLTGL